MESRTSGSLQVCQLATLGSCGVSGTSGRPSGHDRRAAVCANTDQREAGQCR